MGAWGSRKLNFRSITGADINLTLQWGNIMPMLVDPTPRTPSEMMPWEKFLTAIRATAHEALRVRAKTMCALEIEDFEPLRNAMLRELDDADQDGHLPDGLIFVGLKLGVFPAFAYLPTAASCYEIKRFYWSYFQRNALEAIKTGRNRLPDDLLIQQSIESDLANRPLFVPVDAVKDLLNLRPPSLVDLNKLAKKVIDDHRLSSDLKLRKRDFVDRVIAFAPLCNKERAEGAWAKHAPPDWKRPGRPRRA